MIFRIYPIKDTFITNDVSSYSKVRMTGSNVGASEELTVFKRSGLSGVIGTLSSSSLSRILMQFDLSEFSALTASGDIPSSGLSFRLRMNHKTTACTNPASFDLIVSPISSSWDEGVGQDISLGDPGFANWEKRTSTSFWSRPGGDFISSPNAVAHFDTGREDLDLDITSIVGAWISGSIPNNGLAVSLTSSIESDSLFVDYFQKKFYSRQTFFLDRAPYIEVRASDAVRDDRSNMYWSRSGSLFFYNVVGGVFQDLPASQVSVSLSDSSGVFAVLTASRGNLPGIYSASFILSSGSTPSGRPYSGTLFHDSWGSGSFSFGTGSFVVSSLDPFRSANIAPLTARVKNMRDEYSTDETEVFEVAFRKGPRVIPVLQTASLGIVPYIVEKAYYAIENDSTRERVIPFGTGSQQHTLMSYGELGNSFKLSMRNLHGGNVYRILFLTFDQGRSQVIDAGFKFKVI